MWADFRDFDYECSVGLSLSSLFIWCGDPGPLPDLGQGRGSASQGKVRKLFPVFERFFSVALQQTFTYEAGLRDFDYCYSVGPSLSSLFIWCSNPDQLPDSGPGKKKPRAERVRKLFPALGGILLDPPQDRPSHIKPAFATLISGSGVDPSERFICSFPHYSFGAIIQAHFQIQVQEDEAKGRADEKIVSCLGRHSIQPSAGQILIYQAGFRDFDYW